MKKEIPRMLRCASIVYAFDCFGTIFSRDSIFKSTKVLFNPDAFGIRWILIIPGSISHYIKALLLCKINGLKPSQIIRCRTWTTKINHFTQGCILRQTLRDIYDKKNIIKYVDESKIKKVVYVNNDISLDDDINQDIDRMSYDITAMSVLDFWQNKFNHLL